ncbi:transposase [Longimycelium tulufanense]|uniref:transposase n=1 Tax=Longimycelium tulufanense TaxID=907463 RepID=UPI001E486F4E|nr:transposase [Longimycelium tulufanense]
MGAGDRLDGLWCDEDFVDWYPRDGRPGLSPAQLATICVLQFLLDLSDRQAAEAVRCRIDFKYALAMELDDPGLHHSVLADFRIEFDRRQVTCPQGQVSKGWHGPLPDLLAHRSPADRGAVHQGPMPAPPGPPPVHHPRESARNAGFPPQELRDLQVRVRTEQQTSDWQARYAVRSGVKGTVNEFAHGHGMRRCRYRGQPGGPPAARVHGHRREHRAPQRSAIGRRSTPVPATDRIPELLGPARNLSPEVLARRQRLTSRASRSPTESS